MQTYQCHKRVEAAQITAVDVFEDRIETAEEVFIEKVLFARGIPDVGDYLVVYEDGYTSVSPRAVFEAGYSPVGQ